MPSPGRPRRFARAGTLPERRRALPVPEHPATIPHPPETWPKAHLPPSPVTYRWTPTGLLRYTQPCLGARLVPPPGGEPIVSRPARSSRSRGRTYRRVDAPAVSDAPTTPAPADARPAGPAPSARLGAHTSTRITTTDYGYVVGELRRIAVLTAGIVV